MEDKFKDIITLLIDNDGSQYTSQSEALLQLILGNNVYLAGPAGSGKSYVINKYCDMLRTIDNECNIFRTSTTGLSALNIHGETIHGYTGQGLSKQDYQALKKNHGAFTGLWFKSLQKIKATNVLIIDEISMMSESALQFLYDRMSDVLGSRLNNVQIIVAGDFSQLAPVANQSDIEEFGKSVSNYCYGTPAWNSFGFIPCYLDRIYRTKDKRLQTALDSITEGHGHSEQVLNILRSIPVQSSSHIPGVPTLMSTNREVNSTNSYWQKLNTGQEYFFETIYSKTKDVAMAKKMAKTRDVEKELRLRVGDTVMITTNDNESAPYAKAMNGGPILKNGMIGQFVGLSGAKNNATKPINERRRGRKLKGTDKLGFQYTVDKKDYLYLIEPITESILDSRDKEIAGFRQYPFKLAYAISIHKSQGQTFTKLAIDLRKCWTPGLGYVALSRATSINGIYLISPNEWESPWNQKALDIDKRSTVIKKDMLTRAKATRAQYSDLYSAIGLDITYTIELRNHVSKSKLIELLKKREQEYKCTIETK